MELKQVQSRDYFCMKIWPWTAALAKNGHLQNISPRPAAFFTLHLIYYTRRRRWVVLVYLLESCRKNKSCSTKLDMCKMGVRYLRGTKKKTKQSSIFNANKLFNLFVVLGAIRCAEFLKLSV